MFWSRIDSDIVPGTESVMELYERGTEFAIRADGRELMNNRIHGSETALADLALDRIRDPLAARVLVGGLGMGFTLAAALKRVSPEAVVDIAEVVPGVVRWNQGPPAKPLATLGPTPRATLRFPRAPPCKSPGSPKEGGTRAT